MPTPDTWRVQGGNRVVYGMNQFKNKKPFKQEDDVIIFTVEGYAKAKEVKLAGSFTNWQYGAFPMTKTEKGWDVHVKLNEGAHAINSLLTVVIGLQILTTSLMKMMGGEISIRFSM